MIKPKRYTQFEIDFIKSNFKTMTDTEIGEKLGRTEGSIKTFRLRKKLTVPKNHYSEIEKEAIILLYPDHQTIAVANLLGRTYTSVANQAKVLGIRKSKKYLLSPFANRLDGKRGSEYRFKKGHIPVNKGKKMPDEVREKVKHTFFKKGNLPHNTLYDGAIVTRNDKSGHKYKYIRISKGKWEALHRYVWEQKHGKIQDGFNVVFKDGDTLNCDIDNLECISNAELLERQSIHLLPEDLKAAIMTLGALKRKINGKNNQ